MFGLFFFFSFPIKETISIWLTAHGHMIIAAKFLSLANSITVQARITLQTELPTDDT